LDLATIFAIGASIFGVCSLIYALTRQQPRVVIQPSSDYDSVKKDMALLPNKVLQALKSSTSNIRGSMAEHISFLKLSSDYDRLIPIGNVIDFIGIKFDSKSESFDGHIDFIDIKTGKSRLTQDQMKVKRLAEGGRTRFVKVKINTDSSIIGEEPNAD
jgi:predicted Holliday junction resolvase-like endonuclease